MIPGNNILSVALSAIGSTAVNYFQYSSRTTNAGGVMLTNYLAPQTITTGSVQAVSKTKYEALGLDFEKTYISWHVSMNAIDLKRDISGDVIEVLGRRWQLGGSNDWFGIDGWKSLTAVDIGAATGSLTNA